MLDDIEELTLNLSCLIPFLWFCQKGLFKYFPVIKVGLSRSKKILCYLLHWKPFRNDEKWFLFHLKSSFRSQDTWVFVTTFWLYRKNGLIRKIRLTAKFMTSLPGLQTVAIHTFANISQSKGNQTMKFSQLIEYYKANIFLQNYAENEARRLVPELFLFFKKA